MCLCVQPSYSEELMGILKTLKFYNQTQLCSVQPPEPIVQVMGMGFSLEKFKLHSELNPSELGFWPTSQINSPHGAVSKLHYAMESVPVVDYAGKSAPASKSSLERFIASGERFASKVPPPAPPNLLLTAMKKGAWGIKRVPQVRITKAVVVKAVMWRSEVSVLIFRVLAFDFGLFI